ncbi:hypothetical protein BDV18DRAFT_53571 [Aspergillus unguis]
MIWHLLKYQVGGLFRQVDMLMTNLYLNTSYPDTVRIASQRIDHSRLLSHLLQVTLTEASLRLSKDDCTCSVRKTVSVCITSKAGFFSLQAMRSRGDSTMSRRFLADFWLSATHRLFLGSFSCSRADTFGESSIDKPQGLLTNCCLVFLKRLFTQFKGRTTIRRGSVFFLWSWVAVFD